MPAHPLGRAQVCIDLTVRSQPFRNYVKERGVCSVLYCTMYCAVLCIVLYCVLCCTMYCAVLCIVLYYVLYCTLIGKNKIACD